VKGGRQVNPSEELMILLELNGYDVTKFKLKKQLEYEQSGYFDLYKNKTLHDLVVDYYTYQDDQDHLSRNPLMYREDWDASIKSLDQFYVSHPDILEGVTLKHVLLTEEFSPVHKESIIYDILDGWVEEYRESSIVRMENLREMVSRMPKKTKKYKKPSLFAFLLSVLLSLLLMFTYMSPDTLSLPIVSIIGNWLASFVPYLYDYPWFSFFGNVAIYMLIIYAIANSLFRRYIKDIRGEKNKHADKTFQKWNNDMKKIRLEQAGLLEDYIAKVLKKPQKSFFDVTTLMAPENLMEKLKSYVMMVERKYDFMTKYYKTFRLILRAWFAVSLVFYAAFLGLGFALVWGWIGV
jgi:hypothetical protein